MYALVIQVLQSFSKDVSHIIALHYILQYYNGTLSTVKVSLFQGISELIKSLLKDYFKLHKTSLGNPRKVVTC